MSLPRKRAIKDFGWSLAAGLTALLCALSALPAYGEATWDCLEPELRQELNQKLQFQDDFAAAVTSQRPDLVKCYGLDASAVIRGIEDLMAQDFGITNDDLAAARLDHVHSLVKAEAL